MTSGQGSRLAERSNRRAPGEPDHLPVISRGLGVGFGGASYRWYQLNVGRARAPGRLGPAGGISAGGGGKNPPMLDSWEVADLSTLSLGGAASRGVLDATGRERSKRDGWEDAVSWFLVHGASELPSGRFTLLWPAAICSILMARARCSAVGLRTRAQREPPVVAAARAMRHGSDAMHHRCDCCAGRVVHRMNPQVIVVVMVVCVLALSWWCMRVVHKGAASSRSAQVLRLVGVEK
jgi:hypothetical protein